MDIQTFFNGLGVMVLVLWSVLLLFFGLKETTYLFERIENKCLSKKNKEIFVIFPNKEWRRFIKKNKIYTTKDKFSFINIDINNLYKHGLLVKEDIERINNELSLLVELILKNKGGKREVQEIYKSVREFEKRLENGEFLKGYHVEVEREILAIEEKMPSVPMYEKKVDGDNLEELVEELFKKHPEKKNASFFDLTKRIIELNKKLDLNQENKQNLYVLTSKVYKILTEKKREWMDFREKEDIARTEKIKEKIKESRQNYS